MIRQLCYLSTMSEGLDGAALARITAGALRYNETMQLTALFAFGGGRFFQVLEGPRDNVGAAFARICRDRHHHSIRLLQDEAVSGRDFDHAALAVRAFDPGAIEGLDAMTSASAIPAIVAGIVSPFGAVLERRAALAA
jgi:hypothetical protein